MNGTPGWRTAAIWVWALGGLEAGLFGCCAGCMGIVSAAPSDVFQNMPLPPGATPTIMRVAFAVMAVGQLLVLVLPGLALVALGFGVQRGREGSRLASRIILIVQASLFGGWVAINLVSSAVMGQLVGALAPALLMGGVVALQVMAIRALSPQFLPRGVETSAGRADDFDEPWNSHLPR